MHSEMIFYIIIAWCIQAKRNISSWGQNWQNARHIKIQITLSMNAHLCGTFSGQTFMETEQKRMEKWAAVWFHDAALTCIWLRKKTKNSINDKTFRLLAFPFFRWYFLDISLLPPFFLEYQSFQCAWSVIRRHSQRAIQCTQVLHSPSSSTYFRK